MEKAGDEGLMFFDPQSSRRFQQSPDEFSGEWGGNAFVFSDAETLPGILLTDDEMGEIYGGCCGVQRAEQNQGNPGRNEGPKAYDDDPCGAPRWSVNMINMNLFVTDTPLWYRPSVGPSVHISVSYNSQSATANNEIFGNKWHFNYASYLVVDPGGTVTIFMPDGRRDVFTPDGAGGYESPYQVFNRLVRIGENHFELRFPNDTVYVYNIPGGTGSMQPFLVEIRDLYGQSLKLGYNAYVQLKTITDATGKNTSIDYNDSGLVRQVTDPFGRFASFEYDGNRNLTRITDMGKYWTSLDYDEDVYLTGIENEKGKWEFLIEPADGITNKMWENYRITVTNPLKGKEEYYYNGGSGANSWYVSPRDYRSNNFNVPKTNYSFARNISGQQGEIQRTDYPEGGYVTFGYDAAGNRESVTDSHNNKVSYIYNEMGRITSVTDAKQKTTDFIYADNGTDLKEIRRGSLEPVILTYNNAHDVKSVTDRRKYVTTFDYNSYGQLAFITEAKGVLDIVTEYKYNAAYQLEEIIRDGKKIAGYTYDATGRVRTRTDATGLTLTYDYNDLNNIRKITYPDNKFADYSYSGCCPHLVDYVTDRVGRTTYYYYDALKRLTDVITPEKTKIHYDYDANGNLTRLVDTNKNTTDFEYDLDNRLVKKIYADGKYLSFGYDNTGLLAKRVNARKIETEYSYDANRNLETIRYSDSTPEVTYHYDEYDRVEKREDGIGTYIFGYNGESQLESVDGPWENDTLIYKYDALGRRENFSPQGGESVSYKYDRLNRLTEITSGTGKYSYTYYGVGPLVENLIRPNGSLTTYQYDSLNRLTEISNKKSSGEIINKFAYAYSPINDLRSSETITNGNPIVFSQNELITYDYNKVNQLLNSTSPDRIFKYDEDGNMTQGYTPDGYVFTCVYDAEDRLKSLEFTDSNGVLNKTEYIYQGNSLIGQIKKFGNGTLISDTRFIRDGFFIIQERNNTVNRQYLWGDHSLGGIGGLVNLTQNEQKYDYLFDGKGNVTALIDQTQAVVAGYTYDTFGVLKAKIGIFEQPFQFSTKYYDEGTGLNDFGYRQYYSLMGQWINRDPLMEIVGMNLYEFVMNNPLNFSDPYGEQVLPSPPVYGPLPAAKGFMRAIDEFQKINGQCHDQKQPFDEEQFIREHSERMKNLLPGIGETVQDFIPFWRINQGLENAVKNPENVWEKIKDIGGEIKAIGQTVYGIMTVD